MKRVLRILLYIGSGLFLIVFLAEITVHVENVRVRRKGEELLSAIRHLQVGESTLSSTEILRARFGAQNEIVSNTSGSPPEHRYQILSSNYLLNNLRLRFPSLWNLGLRPAAIELELRYQNDKLTQMIYMVHTPLIASSGESIELVAGTDVVENQDFEAPPRFWSPLSRPA